MFAHGKWRSSRLSLRRGENHRVSATTRNANSAIKSKVILSGAASGTCESEKRYRSGVVLTRHRRAASPARRHHENGEEKEKHVAS